MTAPDSSFWVTKRPISVWCQEDGDLIWNQEYTGSRPVALTIIKLTLGWILKYTVLFGLIVKFSHLMRLRYKVSLIMGC